MKTTQKQNWTLENYESVEHQILKKIFKSDTCLTDRFDHEDLFIEYDDKIVIGEFKSRHFRHNQFSDGWMLEKYKYDNLFSKADKYKEKPTYVFYINYFYSDNYLLIWNLEQTFNKYNPETKTRLMNKHSTKGFQRYGEKVQKEVYLLKNDWAKMSVDVSEDLNIHFNK